MSVFLQAFYVFAILAVIANLAFRAIRMVKESLKEDGTPISPMNLFYLILFSALGIVAISLLYRLGQMMLL